MFNHPVPVMDHLHSLDHQSLPLVVVWEELILDIQELLVVLVVVLAVRVVRLQELDLEIHSQEQLGQHHQTVGDMMVDLEVMSQLVLVAVELEELVNQMQDLIPIEDLGVLEYYYPQHLEIQHQHQMAHLVED
jgi:hypothetical protein